MSLTDLSIIDKLKFAPEKGSFCAQPTFKFLDSEICVLCTTRPDYLIPEHFPLITTGFCLDSEGGNQPYFPPMPLIKF